MNKRLILIFFVLLENFSNAKEYPLDSIKQNWLPYFSYSYINSWHKEMPYLTHNPSKVWGYEVVLINDFSIERRKNASFLTKPEYSFCAGLQYPIVKNGILATEVKFSQITNQIGSVQRLRFSDQLDPEKGFVNPTNLKEVKINYAYRVLSFGLFYQIEQKVGKHFTHRMGFKLEYDRLINSVYEISAIKDEQQLYYYNKDLKWYDYYWSINHFINYEAKLYNYGRRTFWLNTRYSFIHPYLSKELKKDKRDTYYYRSNFHLLSVGIKFEI